ncbi:MAG TPA: hypothetical protein VN747_03770, partial [Burkholderiales bacterium]|nr:hypothetical protein [Burkholderiales bacterium]
MIAFAGRTLAQSIEEQLAQAEAQPAHNAVAVAAGADGRWAAGFAAGYADSGQATARALAECQGRQGTYGVSAACELWSVDGERTSAAGRGLTRLRAIEQAQAKAAQRFAEVAEQPAEDTLKGHLRKLEAYLASAAALPSHNAVAVARDPLGGFVTVASAGGAN